MPLHLLGKKSWNVYNHDNVARVKRDEAEAAAREAAEEQAMQEADAARRLKILRGEPVSDLDDRGDAAQVRLSSRSRSPKRSQPRDKDKDCAEQTNELGRDYTYDDLHRKRKRRHGEDDTDRDMRYAKRMLERSSTEIEGSKSGRRDFDELAELADGAALVNAGGNINLFPDAERKANRRDAERRTTDDKERQRRGRDRERSRESRNGRDKREDFDGTMRFSEASGRKKDADQRAWYQSGRTFDKHDDQQEVGRNVWGNEDAGRRQRDSIRMAADDPMAAMRRGVQQVRQVEAERKKWKKEREADMEAIRREEESDRKRRRGRSHPRGDGEDRKGNRKSEDDADVDIFDLDSKISTGKSGDDKSRIRRHGDLDDRHGHAKCGRDEPKSGRHRHHHRHRYDKRSDEGYGRLSRDD